MVTESIVIEECSPARAFAVYLTIPEFEAGSQALAEFEGRLTEPSALLLVARCADRDVGFKVGYDRYRDGSFYSWLGGVCPDYRGDRVAEHLLEAQESIVRTRGYRSICVKTRNRFTGMRVLLTKAGYRVVALDMPRDVHDLDELRIVHVKSL